MAKPLGNKQKMKTLADWMLRSEKKLVEFEENEIATFHRFVWEYNRVYNSVWGFIQSKVPPGSTAMIGVKHGLTKLEESLDLLRNEDITKEHMLQAMENHVNIMRNMIAKMSRTFNIKP